MSPRGSGSSSILKNIFFAAYTGLGTPSGHTLCTFCGGYKVTAAAVKMTAAQSF